MVDFSLENETSAHQASEARFTTPKLFQNLPASQIGYEIGFPL